MFKPFCIHFCSASESQLTSTDPLVLLFGALTHCMYTFDTEIVINKNVLKTWYNKFVFNSYHFTLYFIQSCTQNHFLWQHDNIILILIKFLSCYIMSIRTIIEIHLIQRSFSPCINWHHLWNYMSWKKWHLNHSLIIWSIDAYFFLLCYWFIAVWMYF